jgi:hypothetical protein
VLDGLNVDLTLYITPDTPIISQVYSECTTCLYSQLPSVENLELFSFSNSYIKYYHIFKVHDLYNTSENIFRMTVDVNASVFIIAQKYKC